jgi:hypothetical protein
MEPLDFSHEWKRLMDPYWRKARIAARLLIKREDGKPWSPRDRRLAERFANDSGVTNRLVQQAVNWHKAPHSYHDKLVDAKKLNWLLRRARHCAITNKNCATR